MLHNGPDLAQMEKNLLRLIQENEELRDQIDCLQRQTDQPDARLERENQTLRAQVRTWQENYERVRARLYWALKK